MKKRPYILSIAGFDPSGGAGLLADIKTFEALKCQGLSVCTANTIQTDTDFLACHWIDFEIIQDQIKILFSRFDIAVVKIGIVENWNTLLNILQLVKSLNNSLTIVLDPVLRSSTDFDFQTEFDSSVFEEVLTHIDLLTPNYEEIQHLYPNKSIEETIQSISAKTNLLLKGGHNGNQKGKDFLHTLNGKTYPINPKLKPIYPKHGSGCVLSSAIASHLALGFPLLKSCFRGKRFTEKYLGSSKSLLGRFK